MKPPFLAIAVALLFLTSPSESAPPANSEAPPPPSSPETKEATYAWVGKNPAPCPKASAGDAPCHYPMVQREYGYWEKEKRQNAIKDI
jgi:hypothetical protein